MKLDHQYYEAIGNVMVNEYFCSFFEKKLDYPDWRYFLVFGDFPTGYNLSIWSIPISIMITCLLYFYLPKTKIWKVRHLLADVDYVREHQPIARQVRRPIGGCDEVRANPSIINAALAIADEIGHHEPTSGADILAEVCE